MRYLFGLLALLLWSGVAGAVETADAGAVERILAEKLKTVVSQNMGGGEAAALNNAIDAYLVSGMAGSKDSLEKTVGGLIDKYVAGESAKAALKDAVGNLKNGKSEAVDIGKIAKTVGADKLKDVVSKNMGSKEAAAVNAAIDAYINSGADGAKDSLEKTVGGLIDKYVKGENAQKSLKTAIGNIKNGNVQEIDFFDVATNVAVGKLDDWIDKQNWSESTKKAAKEVLAGYTEGGLDGLTETGAKVFQEKLAERIGAENAAVLTKAATELLKADGKVDWDSVQETASSIVRSELESAIDKQLAKVMKKYPILAELFPMLNLDGKNITNALCNIWGVMTGKGSIADKLAALAGMTKGALNLLVKALGDYLKGKLLGLINQMAAAVKELIDGVLKILNSAVGMVKKVLSDFARSLDQLLAKLKSAATYIVEDINRINMEYQKAADSFKKIKKALD